MKREAELKSHFFQALHRRLPQFLVFSIATAGAPDRVVIGNGFTSFLEFKHADPFFVSRLNQELAAMRLDKQGFCRYVIWYEKGNDRRTIVAKPEIVHDGLWLINNEGCANFDHEWLVSYLKGQHGL